MATIARPFVRITDDTTRAELLVTLEILTAAAKVLSRRGKVGMMSSEYELVHGRINVVLREIERAKV